MTRYDDIPYEDRRNPNLPWGYWIYIDAEVKGLPPLVDEYGHRWRSLREALWVDRLEAEHGPERRKPDSGQDHAHKGGPKQ